MGGSILNANSGQFCMPIDRSSEGHSVAASRTTVYRPRRSQPQRGCLNANQYRNIVMTCQSAQSKSKQLA